MRVRPWISLLPLSIIHAFLLRFRIDKESLWLDEVVNLPASTGSWTQTWEFLKQVPEQHPFYYVLLRGWLTLGSSEVVLRSMSALFALASLWAIFFLTRELFDDVVAMVVTVLLCFSPFHIFYGQEARMYSLLEVLAIVSSYFFLKSLTSTERRWPAWYAVAAIAGVYTHLFFFLVLATHVVFLLVRERSMSADVRRLARVYGAVTLAYLPWALLLMREGPGSESWRGIRHVVFGIPHMLLRFSLGYAELAPNYDWQARIVALIRENVGILALAAGTFALLTIVAIRVVLRYPGNQRLVIWSFALPALVTILASPIVNLVSERYLIVSFPFYVILLGVAFVAFFRGRKSRRLIGAVAAASYTLVVGHALFAYYFDPRFGKEQWSAVASYLRAESAPRDRILIYQSFAVGPLRYYYQPESQHVFGSDQLTAAEVDADDRVWLVLRDPDSVRDRVARLQRSHRIISDTLFRKQSGIRVLLMVRH
jgi:mannosyltransferase